MTGDNLQNGLNQPTEYNLQSDPQGSWNFQIQKQLSPGQHILTVTDEQGNTDSAIIYVEQQNLQTERLINSVTNLVPPNFFAALLSLFLAILFLAGYVIYLARRADDQTEKTEMHYRFTMHAILLCAIVLVVTTISGIYINRQSNFLSGITKQLAIVSTKTSQVSGKIIDPITLQGVRGVDLVAQNTSIRTTDAGQYIFGSVDIAKGIRLTYPNLLRALVLLPSSANAIQQMDVIFSPELYNTLIQTVDSESRGLSRDAYYYLVPEIKNKIDRETYAQSAKSIYTAQNIADQEIVVTQTKILDSYNANQYGLKFGKVVQITVRANDKIDSYFLTFTSDGWRMIK